MEFSIGVFAVDMAIMSDIEIIIGPATFFNIKPQTKL